MTTYNERTRKVAGRRWNAPGRDTGRCIPMQDNATAANMKRGA